MIRKWSWSWTKIQIQRKFNEYSSTTQVTFSREKKWCAIYWRKSLTDEYSSEIKMNIHLDHCKKIVMAQLEILKPHKNRSPKLRHTLQFFFTISEAINLTYVYIAIYSNSHSSPQKVDRDIRKTPFKRSSKASRESSIKSASHLTVSSQLVRQLHTCVYHHIFKQS